MGALLAKNSGILGGSVELKTMQHPAARIAEHPRAVCSDVWGEGALLFDHSGRTEGRRERKDAFHVTVILISDVLVSGKDLAKRFERKGLICSIMHQLFEDV